jgi:predicted DCC family thiol-disulfide oxidoreductase YuxK
MKNVTFDPGRLQTPVTVIYDGTHAASVAEVGFLKSRDKHGKLDCVDLSSATASASDYGIAEAVAGQLYARDASGQVFADIDALFAAHAAIGLGHWFEMCRLPGFMSVGTGIEPKH